MIISLPFYILTSKTCSLLLTDTHNNNSNKADISSGPSCQSSKCFTTAPHRRKGATVQGGEAYLTVVEVDGAQPSPDGGAVGVVVGAQWPYAGDAAGVDGGHVSCGADRH